jgi:hypothetical protein
MFGNRVLRRIFGLKRDEVMDDWRKLHNEELHNVCFSQSLIRIMKSGDDVMGGGDIWQYGREEKCFYLFHATFLLGLSLTLKTCSP